MNAWRVAYGMGLFVFVAIPLLMPFRELYTPAAWIWTPDDLDRLATRSLNTLALSGTATALSLPFGLSLAVLLFRTSFFGRRFLLFLLAFTLFVPLPVTVSSWQGLLGADGWLPLAFWRGSGARPWATGLDAAIWIHTLAAIPWVTFIVGLGLSWVEPEMEEEAAQSVGPWRVLAFVTLPRARASILAAALFVFLQTAAETSVTDIMLVATLADETRIQFTLNDHAGLARTLVITAPMLLLAWASVLTILAYIEKHLPPPAPSFRPVRTIALGSSWLRVTSAFLLLTLLVVPLFALAWKLGLSGHPSRWDAAVAGHFLRAESRLLGSSLLATLTLSLVTGFVTTGVALVGCWLARDCRWFRWLLFSVLTGVWIVPGPIVGIGLHDLILFLPSEPVGNIALEKVVQFLKAALYHGPSPLPIMWVQTIRVLPIAILFLWPVVRLIPREWFAEARLGGAGALSAFLHVVVPTTWRAALVTALAAAALCLGEVAASSRVETPGWNSFTSILLDRMHYSVDNSLAALSLMMLGSLAVLALVGCGLWKVMRFFSYRQQP